MVVPAGTNLGGASFGGVETTVDTRISCNLTVREKVSLAFSKETIHTSEELSIAMTNTLNTECYESHCDLEVMVLQDVNGKFVYTPECNNLLVRINSVSLISFNENGIGSITTKNTEENGVYKSSQIFHISPLKESGSRFMITVRHHGEEATCIIIYDSQETTE
jgi:hypothetical protein